MPLPNSRAEPHLWGKPPVNPSRRPAAASPQCRGPGSPGALAHGSLWARGTTWYQAAPSQSRGLESQEPLPRCRGRFQTPPTTHLYINHPRRKATLSSWANHQKNLNTPSKGQNFLYLFFSGNFTQITCFLNKFLTQVNPDQIHERTSGKTASLGAWWTSSWGGDAQPWRVCELVPSAGATITLDLSFRWKSCVTIKITQSPQLLLF